MTLTPTQGTPGGCLIGCIAIFPAVCSGLGIWGLIKWFKLADENQEFNTYFWAVLGAALIGGVITVLLVFVSLRALRSADFTDYDSRDPDRTNLKW